MHKIDGAGHLNNTFVVEDLQTNRPPTEVTADWLNAVQNEIANVIQVAGLTLDKEDNTQLYQAIQGLINATGGFKAKFTTTANINLIGLAAQAGGDWPSALSVEDVILVRAQSNPAQNGVYAANSGAWTRVTWFDQSVEVQSGVLVSVLEGATLADTNWQLITDGTINLGTTALTWQQTNGQEILAASETQLGIAEIATLAETLAGSDDSKFITPFKLVRSALIGVMQTWQDFTGSRANATVYTNTTGKPIAVNVRGSLGPIATSTMTVGGIVVSSASNGFGDRSVGYTHTAIVPNGSTYSISNMTIVTWAELRS